MRTRAPTLEQGFAAAMVVTEQQVVVVGLSLSKSVAILEIT
jgi:hypothetical protein